MSKRVVGGVKLEVIRDIFEKRILLYSLKNIDHDNIEDFFTHAFPLFCKKTEELIKANHVMKSNACLSATFKKKISVNPKERDNACENSQIECELDESKLIEIIECDDDGKIIDSDLKHFTRDHDESEYETQQFYFRTPNIVLDIGKDLEEEFVNNIVKVIVVKIDEFQEHGSGWIFDEITCLDVYNYKYDCFNGSSYIPLPKSLQSIKAIVNVKNLDNQCFKWCILAALHPVEDHAERIAHYETFEDELIFSKDLTFPIQLKDISKFEKLNEGISINVYGIDHSHSDESSKKRNVNIIPLRLTKEKKENHIHLLLMCEYSTQNQETENNEHSIEECIRRTIIKSHYCLIKDIGMLVKTQETKNKRKIFVCDCCLNYFGSEFQLNAHKSECDETNECRITMPTKLNKYITFKNFNHQLEAPFIIYADIESVLLPVDGVSSGDFMYEKRPKGAFQKHAPNSIGFYFHSRISGVDSFYKSFTNENCIKMFVNKLYDIANEVGNFIRFIKPMDLRDSDEEVFLTAKKCHICDHDFLIDEIKVRDHCHLTGEYRGAAHRQCNLKYQITRSIPIVFHNLGYDSHFLIDEIVNNFSGQVFVIPVNNEHYIGFTKMVDDTSENDYREKIKFHFIDSFRFMASSLQKLASYLPTEMKQITKKEWNELNSEQIQLLEQKGVYPYDYMDSTEKLEETSLSAKEYFYNKLTDSNISDCEYEFAKKVWKELGIKNLKEYTEIYLKTDVLLLADVFENFRNKCLQIYKIDPAHYYTAPGLSWDAMLKFTDVRIELLTDVDKLLFVEKGIEDSNLNCSFIYKYNTIFLLLFQL